MHVHCPPLTMDHAQTYYPSFTSFLTHDVRGKKLNLVRAVWRLLDNGSFLKTLFRHFKTIDTLECAATYTELRYTLNNWNHN